MILFDIFITIFYSFIVLFVPALILIGLESKSIDTKLGVLLYFIILAIEILFVLQFGAITFHETSHIEPSTLINQ